MKWIKSQEISKSGLYLVSQVHQNPNTVIEIAVLNDGSVYYVSPSKEKFLPNHNLAEWEDNWRFMGPISTAE